MFPLLAGLGHIISYGTLSLLFYRAFNLIFGSCKTAAARSALIFDFNNAITEEVHQIYVPGRLVSFADVIIDMG